MEDVQIMTPTLWVLVGLMAFFFAAAHMDSFEGFWEGLGAFWGAFWRGAFGLLGLYLFIQIVLWMI